MRTVSLVQAKAQLSKLVDEAADGAPFAITKHGRPVAVVTAAPGRAQRPARIGFLRDRFGDYRLPDNFDTMMADEIAEAFEDGPA
jgi:prevent-host-death family protein